MSEHTSAVDENAPTTTAAPSGDDASAVAATLSDADAPAPGPAPERAGRRAAGASHGVVDVGLALLVPVVVAGAAAAALLTTEPLPAPKVEAPAPVDTTVLVRTLDELQGKARDAGRVDVARAADALADALVADLPRLATAIAEARDARKAKDAAASLSAPFSSEELEPARAALGLDAGRGRFVIRRDGAVVLPAGATTGFGDALASATTTDDRKVVTVDDDGAIRVAVRACVPREKHCLVEVARYELPVVDVGAARALIDELARPAPPPVDVGAAAATAEAAVARRGLAGLAAGLAVGLLLAVVVARRMRRTARAIIRREEALVALAHGARRALDDGGPREIMMLDRAIEAVAARVAEVEAQESERASLRAALDELTDALLALDGGALDARLPATREASRAVEAAFNLVAARFERLAGRLHAHVAAASDEAPTASRDEARADLSRRVEGLRPLALLLGDIASRARSLARAPDEQLVAELQKLSDAVERRAKTATQLVDGLERALEGLPPSTTGDAARTQLAFDAIKREVATLARPRDPGAVLLATADLGPDVVRAQLAAPAAAPRPG